MTTTRKTTSKKTSTKTATKKPIDLGISIFPGGVFFVDKNRKERGDYKTLAVVRFNGVIDWYVNEKTLPSKIVYWILKESRRSVQNFERTFNNFNKYRSNNPFNTKEKEDYERYLDERNEYFDQISNREKAIHSYPAKRRR